MYTHYLYDAQGTRIKKITRKAGGKLEITIYIDTVFEHSYVKQTGTTIDATRNYNTLHIMDDQSRIATLRVGADADDSTAAVKYNLAAHLGSSNVLLDSGGAPVSREEYFPFGDTSFGSYAKKRYRFTGKEKDSESGLYYYGARYYSAWTCRFISADPLAADFPYLTPYNYAGNKPITHKDIDGLQGTGDAKVDNRSGNGQSGGGGNTLVIPQVNNVAEPDALRVETPTIIPIAIAEEPKSITTKEAAVIADNVGGGPDAAKLINSWQKSDIQIPGVKFNDSETGLQSAIYQRTNSEGVTEYAYAFAGTDTDSLTEFNKDIKEGAAQALGLNAPQYEQAAKNARTISKALKGSNLTFVGYSLGGGLASAASLATGRNGITFNAAGLHPNTKAANKLNESAQIDAYVVQGEIVDYTQSAIGLKAEGTIHTVKASYFGSGAISLGQRINNHLMGTMRQKLQKQGIR